ncbi:MMPL family transporter [Corynebacterium sp. sy039]|uniref:MMPL family transporter n=1 Tax=Corynebacterium sp. sy039 TaxID=2599641 RepID=UPI0011B6F42E|nr:MMPL family transporter [Corynebacterium sp. sy039]QDZ41947.1 MMPL family transporter [Corynebacterium sp. sy039]
MFSLWGGFSYRHRRIIPIVVTLLILVLFALCGTKLNDRMSQEGWEDPHSASTQAAAIEEETFGRDSSGDVIMLFDDPSGISSSAQFEAISTYLSELQRNNPDRIASINSYFDQKRPRNKSLVSADGTTAFAAIALKGDDEQTLKDFRAIESQLAPHFPGVSVSVAGATAVADALDEGMTRDIRRAELYALPLVGVLLLIVFGSVIAAFMPLIVGGLSILGSMGVLALLAQSTQVNVFAQSVITLLGLGLAIDYGLFMVSRFREELDKGNDVETAVRTTTATAGQTVAFSAAMVAVALSALLIFPQAFLKSVAYGAISAVALAALLSITVLPALFGVLGTKIDAFTIRKTSRVGKRIEDTWWYKIPQWAIKHAKVVTVVIVTGLIALAVPLTGIKFGGLNETYLPPDHQVRVAQQKFDEQFPNFRTDPVKLIVKNASNDQLIPIYAQANKIEGLTSRFSYSATVNGVTVLSAGITDRDDNEHVIEQLRAIEAPAGVELLIGGTPALGVESIEALVDRAPFMALYIILATFLLMSLVFGSMVLPLKAIIMTVLGLGSTLGLLTLMFVHGIGSGIFNFTAGPLMSPVLMLIIAIVYGLSTDYEVFLVSRMVEARTKGNTTDRSIIAGTAHTGGIITAAALIMIVVCGAFGFSEIVMMKYIAFGMIFALLFDATVIRMLLVPAVMHLLRTDNWWAPQFVKKLSAKIGHGNRGGIAVPKTATVPVAPPPTPPTPSPTPPAPPTPSEDTELSIDAVQPVHNTASRSGRAATDNNELVPFSELIQRIREEKQ